MNKAFDLLDIIVKKIFGFIFKIMHKEYTDGIHEATLQFVKFGIVGVTNTVVSYVIYVGTLLGLQKAGLFPKVDYQIVPSDQYESLLMTKINAGECTDIFGGQSSQFSIVTQFDVEKNAVDLSGESWAGNVDPAAAVELSAGGKLYGQPIQDVSACWAVAYNISMFVILQAITQLKKMYKDEWNTIAGMRFGRMASCMLDRGSRCGNTGRSFISRKAQ